jgi:hypothetical protein
VSPGRARGSDRFVNQRAVETGFRDSFSQSTNPPCEFLAGDLAPCLIRSLIVGWSHEDRHRPTSAREHHHLGPLVDLIGQPAKLVSGLLNPQRSFHVPDPSR